MRVSKRVVSEKTNRLPVGEILQNTGLINQGQIDKAFRYQQELGEIKLEKILCIQEEINIKTIDFLLGKWEEIKQKGYQFPIGYYLQQSFLLDDKQIKTILVEQKEKQLKFGDIAVEKGWIKKKTIDFFLDNLSANPAQLMSLKELEEYNQEQLHLECKYSNCPSLLARILGWTKGHPDLTTGIFQAFANNNFNIPLGKEYLFVDDLVQDLIINWSSSKLENSIREHLTYVISINA